MKKILILGKQNPIAGAILDLMIHETDWNVLLEMDNYDTEVFKLHGLYQPVLYDKKTIRKTILSFAPNYIINCLSLNDPEYIENNRKYAWDFNVGTVEALAKAAFMTESKLVMFSTDNIYSGLDGPYHEEHLPDPVNYYGKTLLGCENYCISNNVPYISVRIPEYYGNGNTLGSNTFFKLINNMEVNLADNVFTSPVLVDDIALSVLKLIEKDRFGFYNIGGSDYVSEFTYGSKIIEYFQLNSELIKPYTYTHNKNTYKKLIKGGLINLKSQTDLNINFVNLHSGLTTARFQMNFLNP